MIRFIELDEDDVLTIIDNTKTLLSLLKISDVCPFEIGEKIHVKEDFAYWEGNIIYRADKFYGGVYTWYCDEIIEDCDAAEDVTELNLWEKAEAMDVDDCRLRLIVQNIVVKRLYDITEEEAKANGEGTLTATAEGGKQSHRLAFFASWQVRHGKDSLASNPWIWLIQFKKEK